MKKHNHQTRTVSLLIFLALAGLSFSNSFGQITATLTTTTATCQANGELKVSAVTGGKSPYQVALIAGPNVPQPAVFITPNSGSDFVFTGLQSGLHKVSVLDNDGNMKEFSATVGGNYQIMNYTPVPSVTACNSGTPGTGTITITGLTGGNPPYRYRLFTPTTSAFQNGNVFTGLVPGTTYQVQVFDACENFQTRQVQIPAIAVAGLPTPSTLFEDCDGTVKTTYSATGGNTPYTYQVTAGPTLVGTTNTTGVFNFNTSGNYTVRVTDNCGGTATRTFTTPGKPNQQLLLQGAMGSACDNMGGGVAILVRNGIPPYTGILKGKAGSACASTSRVLNLSGSGNGDYTQTIMGLTRPCMYVVEVTDKCGNITTEELNLVNTGANQLGASHNVLCPTGTSTQYRLQMIVSLGPPYSPRANYTFNLLNSSNQPVSGFPRTQATTSFTVNLPAGTYTYQLVDACGTTSSVRTVVVPAYADPTVGVDLTAQCINAGQARLITTRQNPLNSANPAFKITAGPDRVNETNNTGIYSNLRSGGTYTFEFNDGCKKVTTTATLPPYRQPSFEVAYGVICPPNTVATLQAVGLSGTVVQPYQFEIIATNTTGGITRPPSADSTFTNLSAGQYNVRGFDGCNNSFTFLGKIGPIPTPKILLDPNPACEGTDIKVRPDVFVFGATYTVFRNDTVIYTGSRGINTLPAIAGDYKIRIQVSGGCNATSPVVKLNIVGKLLITNPAAACIGTTVNLTAAAVTTGSSSGTLAYFQDEDATVPLDGTTGPSNAIKKAGDYYIRLTTTNPSCVTIKKVTVTFKDTPAAPTATPTQPTCTTATGIITVTAPTTGVTYSFNNGSTYQAGNVSGPLNPGTYQIKVKGTNDCVSAATAVILNAQPATPVAPAVTLVQLTCTTATGTITVTTPASGVTYSFDNGANYQASATSGPLAAGAYQVKVKNTQGCESVATPATLNPQPATPAAPTVSITQPTCTTATGTITITAPTSGVTYSFDNGLTFQSANTSNSLSAATYQVRVKNAQGCVSVSTPATLDAQPPTPVAPAATVVQPTCTVATGVISVTTPPTATEYSFDNGATYQSANVSPALAAGVYQVRVKNAEGCTSVAAPITINAQPPTPAAPAATVTQPTCTVATGIISVTAPGSDTEYSFDNGATFQTSTSSNPLVSGEYFIRVKNADGCVSDSTSVTLATQPPTPAAPSSTVTQPTCEVSTGVITINTTATATQFSFDNGATFQNSKVSGPLTAGDYFIKVKNTEGCISDSTAVTIAPQPPTPSAPTVTTVQPTCTVATGTITVTAPATATEYSFDNGATFQASNVSPALAAGAYSIKVKNANGCISDSTAVTIDPQPATPAAPTARLIQPTCDEATGIIIVTAPPTATEYSFDNGVSFQNSSTSDPLTSGDYFVRVKNAVGCISDSTKVTILPQPATPAAPVATVTQPTCTVATGTIAVTNSVNIINYSFDNGATYQADSLSPALPAGTYLVKVQNDDGCFSDSTLATIDPQPATPTLIATDKTCAPDLKTYTVTFTSDGVVTASLGTVDNLAKTVSGIPADSTVALTASANGCERIITVTAPNCSCPSIAPPVVATPEITICEGQTIPAFTATVGDGLRAIWYDAPTDGTVLLDNSLSFTPTGAGAFYVEAADIVSDCRSTSRVKVELIINPQPTVTIGAITCRQSGLFYDIAYTATPGAVVSANKGFVTDTSIRRVPAGEMVKIMVTLNGCKDSTTVTQNCALPYGSLGDFVWQDINANGQQDDTEPGIGNVLVYLLDDNGAILDSTRTSASGKYGFDSLSTGKYQVKFFLPEGYDGFTKIRVPGSDTLDSDADSAGLSQLVTIETAQDSTSSLRNNPTIDAGFTRLGSIGDFVFEDKNNDGIQTPGEPGIVGVTVYLLDSLGTIIDSTLTKAGGKYMFDSLTAGIYQVQFVAPPGYGGFTQPNQGGDPTKDSNAGTDGKSQRITIDVSKAKTDTLRNTPTIDAGVISRCIQPIISSTKATAATCGGKTANADARFTLRGLSNGDRFTFATTEAALLPYVTATALTADSIQVSGLANPDSTGGLTYFVRIYNTRQGCFKDTTVLIPFRDCGSVCVQPQAGPDVFVCKPATTTDLPDALSYEEWVVSPKNKATATIDPATGAVGGLNESGIYAFILRDKTLGSTCADTVFVFRGVLNLAMNQTSCTDTLTLPAVVGATYSLVQGNAASITPEGKVTGLTTPGTIYKFLISNGQCTDTIQVERLRCTLIYDLALNKAISKKLAMLGDTLSYTITVFNQGEGVVHGIEVTDSLNAGVQYLGSVAESGSYSFATHKWSFDSLAVGDTTTLSIRVRVIAHGPWFNTAEITKMTEKDEDSTPGNGKGGEDDIDRECFTVPALICRGQGLSAMFTVPVQYTGVEWFRRAANGETIKVGEGNTYTASETELGSYEYTFTSTNGTCPATGCCPAIVVVQDCCPADVCVPFVIKKRAK